MPTAAGPVLVTTVLLYFLAVAAIGVWAIKRTRSARDFFIAGQRLGLAVTALATMSAAFSGFVFIGGPGLTYRAGLGSLFICVPAGFTAALLTWTVAKRLRLLAEVREVYTVPDALLARYGSRLVSGLGAVAVVVGSVGYLAAQLLALGVLVETVFGTRELLGAWSLPAAMAAGLAVILFYSTAGGMVAGVYTDLLQGGLMMATALAVFAWALAAGGGLGAMTRSIAASPAFGEAFLDPLGSLPAATGLGFFFVFGVGVLGQPQMLHKLYMLRDPRRLKWFPLALAGSQVLCLLLWVGIGLAVPALVAEGRLPPLANPDDAAPLFLLHFTPSILAGLALAGVLAAVMSTADSFLNIAGAALVRDLPRAFGRRVADELAWGRAATVAVALAAAVAAYLYGDLVALLGTFAFGTFAAALAPALAVGLNWRRVTAKAAAASIATGVVVNLGLELLVRPGFLPALSLPLLPAGTVPSAVALAASFTVLFAVTAGSGRRAAEPLPEDVEAVMEM